MINFLYTNIGRGHPFYLDGVVETLKRSERLKYKAQDVFEISKDPALSAWRMARWLYKIGATDSVIGKWYNSLRDKTDHNQSSFAMRVMGADLRKVFLDDETPLLVDHPVLVGMLKGKKNLLYQHGEIAVPRQSLVIGADAVFVPTKKSAGPFIEYGYDSKQVIVTGLCIEPKLAEQSDVTYENRTKRIREGVQLTGAFYSSGAEPNAHLEKLIEAAISSAKSGGRALVFAQKKGKLCSRLSRVLSLHGAAIEMFVFETRKELDRITAEHFEKFDYLVSPSHERTNWSLGLGLPMFILEPAIGPFAPLNRASLIESGTAMSISSIDAAAGFGVLLNDLRSSGKLVEMANLGWKKLAISGFQTIADFLINKYAPNP
jgi:hypothetical protein